MGKQLTKIEKLQDMLRCFYYDGKKLKSYKQRHTCGVMLPENWQGKPCPRCGKKI